MDEDKTVAIHPETGEPIKQSEVDRWCNCGNFPFEKCDECKYILETNKCS